MRKLGVVMLVLAVCWAVAVMWGAAESLPHMPIDLNPNAPDVQAAYNGAVMRHLARQALIALAPLTVVLVAWLVLRRRSVNAGE